MTLWSIQFKKPEAQMDKTRKQLKEEYKHTSPAMGVYQIRNLINSKVFIGSALNLKGILNSNRFQLDLGSHRNKKLQADWNEFGSANFALEVLDELAATNGVDHDYKPDLTFLEEMWLDKLEPYKPRGYNQRKKQIESQ